MITLAICSSGARLVAEEATPAKPAEDEVKRVDARFQREIDAAIGRGVRYLAAKQDTEGGWGYRDPDPSQSWAIGVAALCGLALRHGGLEIDDPHVLRARSFVANEIRRHWVPKTDAPAIDAYSAGLAVSFLLEAGVARDDATLVRTVRTLEAAYTMDGYWDYQLPVPSSETSTKGKAAPARNGGGNTSTTLYAVYGLHAAHAHGMEVDARGLELLCSTMLPRQSDDGGIYYYPHEHEWARTSPRRPPPYFGSTSNALAAYLMAGDVLGTWKRPQDALDDRVVRDGVAWIEKHYDPSAWDNDGWDPVAREPAYGLYGAERLAMLLATERFGKVAWYERGARYLLSVQEDAGSWALRTAGSTYQMFPARCLMTSYALLFLARADRPIGERTPSGRGVVTGSSAEDLRFDGAPGLPRKDWYDLYHRAMSRLDALGGAARTDLSRRLAGLGPRVAYALVDDLESDRRERRTAARDALLAVVGEDFGFEPDGDAKSRAKSLEAWRKWLGKFGPDLVLEGGVLITRPAPTGSSK